MNDIATFNARLDMNQPVMGDLAVSVQAARCANPDCLQPVIHVAVGKRKHDALGNFRGIQTGTELFDRRIIPEGAANPQPEHIPAPLIQDYMEACLIRDLSPKASATLSRRCLQGMIRHFCEIKKGRLVDEISELRKRVDSGNAPKGVSPESVDAIDHVRKICNIGAHMEKDINIIVDVEPEEAQLLIELIETLFDEWYVAQHKREQRFAKIKIQQMQKRLRSQKLKQKSPRNRLRPNRHQTPTRRTRRPGFIPASPPQTQPPFCT